MANLTRLGLSTFAAAASLALCLTAAGCGSDTKLTKPNPSDYQFGKVTFNYSEISARTSVPEDAINAIYTFSGDGITFGSYLVNLKEDKPVPEEPAAKTAAAEEKIPDFIIENTDEGTDVIFNSISVYASKVSVFYLDSSNNVISAGVNEINWNAEKENHAKKESLVSSPDINAKFLECMGQIALRTYPNHVDKGEYIWIRPVADYTRADGKVLEMDLSEFATYDVDEDAYLRRAKYHYDKSEQDYTVGYYLGKYYGSQEVSAVIGNVFDDKAETTAYVTDAVLQSIYINDEELSGDLNMAAADENFGQDIIVADGNVLRLKNVKLTASGKYVSANGNPNFEGDVTDIVGWGLTNNKDFSGSFGNNAYTVKASNTEALAETEVNIFAKDGQGNSIGDTVVLKSAPAKAKLELDLDDAELIIGKDNEYEGYQYETYTGNAYGKFLVTLEKGKEPVESNTFYIENDNVVAHHKLKGSVDFGSCGFGFIEGKFLLSTLTSKVGDLFELYYVYKSVDGTETTSDKITFSVIERTEPDEGGEDAGDEGGEGAGDEGGEDVGGEGGGAVVPGDPDEA